MMKYDYNSSQIERDFVLKKVWGDCYLDPNNVTLIGVPCKSCPYYDGMKKFYRESNERYKLSFDKIGTFVFCKYHKEDDEEAREAVRQMYEKFREEAIAHFYD